MEQGEKLTPEAVQHALKDAATKLEPGLQQCLIYMIHTWAPELDDTLKLEVLCSATGDFESPYSMRVLMDNYREKKSYSMLLTLLQRQISQNVLAPKRRIPLEIEYSHILAESVNMPALAVRRLDAIKSIVMKYASPSERVEYALAYHGAMHTGRALQYLRDWMNLTQNPDEITAYGLHLARLMYENHEPIQSVIENPLSEKLLAEEFTAGMTVTAGFRGGEVTFTGTRPRTKAPAGLSADFSVDPALEFSGDVSAETDPDPAGVR